MDAYFQWLNERHRAENQGIAQPLLFDLHAEHWDSAGNVGCGGNPGAPDHRARAPRR